MTPQIQRNLFFTLKISTKVYFLSWASNQIHDSIKICAMIILWQVNSKNVFFTLNESTKIYLPNCSFNHIPTHFFFREIKLHHILCHFHFSKEWLHKFKEICSSNWRYQQKSTFQVEHLIKLKPILSFNSRFNQILCHFYFSTN